MKKIILFFGTVSIIALSTSCKKCATCTFNDPIQGKLSTEVCSSGHSYDSAIKVYEDNGWTCAK